jgi:hypothetical protein
MCRSPAMRLLSFLTDIEHALLADDPAPLGGAWETSRSANYHQGVARLTLAARRPGAASTVLGAITIQEFLLADGSSCLKSFLAWEGSSEEASHAIYETANTQWTSEARRVAASWLAGRERVALNLAADVPPLAATA